jgi:7,8-dihydro-6-hydroxymethylpterin-pyrophosphokinase
MTPQERAAAFVQAWMKQPTYTTESFINDVLEHDKQTRRAALLEAADEIERFIDYSGGCVGTENDPRVVAVNRFITINIVPLLNRLAQEG